MTFSRRVALLAAGLVALTAGFGTAGDAAAGVGGTGIATHYILKSGGGNCTYPGPPANGLFVALWEAGYDNGAACGSYLEVSGPEGSVRVEVIDSCGPCRPGHIDLSMTAYGRIAPISTGIAPIRFRTLTNPPLPGPVALVVQPGSSRYWLSLVVMNTGNALTSVQVAGAGGSWHALVHASYNAWSGWRLGPGPFRVRLTDTAGHRVTAGHIALVPGAVQKTGTWMYRS